METKVRLSLEFRNEAVTRIERLQQLSGYADIVDIVKRALVVYDVLLIGQLGHGAVTLHYEDGTIDQRRMVP